jgi:hypothetical protein
MRKTILSCALALTLVLSSCATIISGSKQNVKINSNPTVATVFVDGGEQGKTPLEVKLKRNTDHKISLVLEGYKPYDVNLTRKTNGWVWGNILFGGLIGLIVDMSTGSIYRLSPNEINGDLAKSIGYNKHNSGIYIYATMEASADLEKVGQLEKE